MNNLYEEKEKGWRTRAAPGGGPGAAIQPGCGVERGSEKTTLWVPSRHALIQGSAARACLLAGPTSPRLREQPRAPDGGLSGPLPPLGPAALTWVNASPATSAWSRPGAGSTSPRLPWGLLDQSPEPPASRRPHPLPPWTAPPAGLLNPTRPARQLPPLVPSGAPFRTPSSLSSCAASRPSADTPAPRLQPVCPAQLPAAPGQLSSSRDAHVHAFLPDSLLPRLCTHGWTYSHLRAHTYLRMNTDTHILLHTHVYTIPGRHTNTLTHKNTHSYVLMHTHKHSHTGTCRHTFTHLDTRTSRIHMDTDTHTNTQTHTHSHTHT